MLLSLNNLLFTEYNVKHVYKKLFIVEDTVIFLEMNLIDYLQYTWLDNVILSCKNIFLISEENLMVYY